MPMKQEQVWDALADAQCAEGSRGSSAVLRTNPDAVIRSASHIQQKEAVHACTPKGGQEGPPARPGKGQMWEHGC